MVERICFKEQVAVTYNGGACRSSGIGSTEAKLKNKS